MRSDEDDIREIYEVLEENPEDVQALGCYAVLAVRYGKPHEQEMRACIRNMLVDETEDAEEMSSAFFACLGLYPVGDGRQWRAKYEYLIELMDMLLGGFNAVCAFEYFEDLVLCKILNNLMTMYPERVSETTCLMNYEASFYAIDWELYKKADTYADGAIKLRDEVEDTPYVGIIARAYIIKAENVVNLNGEQSKAEEYLRLAYEYLSLTTSDEEYEEIYIKLSLSAARIYMNAGDFDRGEIFSADVYKACKEGFGDATYLLAATYNLALAATARGSFSTAGNYVNEAKEIVREYGLENLAVAVMVDELESQILRDSGSKEEQIDKAIRELDDCMEVSVYNMWYIVNSISVCVQKEFLTWKNKRTVERVLALMDKYRGINYSDTVEELYRIASAMYALACNDVARAVDELEMAVDKEFETELVADDVIVFMATMQDFFSQIFSLEKGRRLVLRMMKGLPLRLQRLLLCTDEMEILRRLAGISDFSKMVVAAVALGRMRVSDEDFVELVVNSKNLYPDVLAMRRLIEENGDDVRHREVDDIHRQTLDIQLRKMFNHPYEEYGISLLKQKRHDLEIQILDDVSGYHFRWITFREIAERLPNQSLYVDFSEIPLVFDDNPMLKDLYYVVFALSRDDSGVKVRRFNNINLLGIRYQFTAVESLLREKYGDNLFAKLGRVVHGDRLVLRTLYNFLLKDPVQAFAGKESSVKILIISGDAELSSFPFDALLMDDGRYVLERFELVTVNSIRNYKGKCFIAEDDKSKAVVIGNPSFTIDQSKTSSVSNPKLMVQLPLTKIEAQAAADALNAEPFLRGEAVKGLLYESDCKLLHIATHGDHLNAEYGKEMSRSGLFGDVTNPLSTSCLFFSGANDWISSGWISKDYGTGILTGEELLTCRLPNLKCAVITSCFSGGGDINYSVGLIGMRTAFAAIGVEAVITNMWEVDDLASAILMTEYYKGIDCMSVSEALWTAKKYLRTVTVGELKENGWFGESRIRRLGLVAEDMRKLAQKPDDARLFERPFYWAGFTVMEQKTC